MRGREEKIGIVSLERFSLSRKILRIKWRIIANTVRQKRLITGENKRLERAFISAGFRVSRAVTVISDSSRARLGSRANDDERVKSAIVEN